MASHAWRSVVLAALAVVWFAGAAARAGEQQKPAAEAEANKAAGDAEKGEAKKEKKPAKGIVISKETTRLEGPLTEDGRIDYLAALNASLSEGITPENNAAVPLCKALGPETVPPAVRAKFFERLGIDVPPAEGAYYLGFSEFVRDYKTADGETGDELARRLDEELIAASGQSWAAMDHPDLAEWLRRNQAPLDAICEGLKRPRYYLPLVAPDDGPFLMISVLLPTVQASRDVARALAARAMLRLGSGKLGEALADSLALHRLARHVGSGATLIEVLVGCAIDAVACSADAAVVRSGKLTAAKARDYAAALAALPRLADMVEKIDVTERYMYLDCVMGLAVHGPDALSEYLGGGESRLMTVLTKALGASLIDWNEPLKAGNLWYDRLVAAGRKKTYAQRKQALDDLDAELNELVKNSENSLATLGRVFLSGKSVSKTMGREMGNVLVALLLPAVNAVVLAEDRHTARFDEVRLMLLLEAYRGEHDAYPESLSALEPKYVGKRPRDPFTGEDFIYRRTEKGYELYSAGPNGKDDGGAGSGHGHGDLDDVFIPPPRAE